MGDAGRNGEERGEEGIKHILKLSIIGSGASFGADKNPAPYKLFIAKRELTLECRRLLRARCECMSYENKKSILSLTSPSPSPLTASPYSLQKLT